MNQEYFTVELGSGRHLGVPLANMGAAAQFEVQNVCTVPGVADFWHGVVNFKGSLLWVLDSDRFFNLSSPEKKQPQKLTAVILKSEELGNPKKVAIVTQKLTGILSVKSSELKPLEDHASPQLHKCCNAFVQTESAVPQLENATKDASSASVVADGILRSQRTYIIDSSALLQQLHQQSILLSA